MQLGSYTLDRPLALAPMDDVTDISYRTVLKRHGVDLLVTEFVSCEALIRDAAKAFKKMEFAVEERPIGIQIVGALETSMTSAAMVVEKTIPDFIDINAGCWVKDVAMKGSGAGLLQDLNKFESIVRGVVKAVNIPVTVKTRLGWKADQIVILDVARMIEQTGAAALFVHCRTRDQGHSGFADWSWLEKIKSVISIPLIGNGDVKSPEDAKRMFDTGCDGIMIGRAAITNPWIFREIKHYLNTGEHLQPPSIEERVAVCIDHLHMSVRYKGERRGVIEHRKYYSGYLRGLPNVSKVRAELMQWTEVQPVIDRIMKFADDMKNEPIDLTALPPLGGLIGTRYESQFSA
jgi:tRNA-dihydrouridine synthase B